MTSCELCAKQATTKARIEGVVLSVCASCARLGVESTPAAPSRARVSHTPLDRVQRDLVTDFGSRIRTARHQRGLTEEDAAKQLNVHKSTLLHIEAGKLRPDDALARRFERFFHLTLFEDV